MKVLKSCLNKKDFKWTEEAEKAFQDIKQLLKELPTLTAPIEGETSILYLAASAEAISSVIIAERKGLKVKFLADFLLETTEKVDHPQNVKASNHVWELHTDGASSEEGVGAGLVLTSPEDEEHTYALRFCFYASNNEAEYEVNGGFEAKDISMKQYLQLVEKISKKFETLEVVQIPRNKNKKADVLSKLATLTFDHLHKKVLVEVLKDKSVDEKVVVATVEEREPCWITPYVKYLQDGTLPTDAIEARRIRVSAPLYVLKNRILYRKSFSGPNLRCLTPQQAIDVVKEMHEGLCAQHSGYRTVVGRIMRQGYYWQSICKDTIDVIKTCDACQRHGTVQRLPKYGLPNKIVSDNGKHFADNPFRSWCEELNIKQTFTSVAHPQANGQVEGTNKEIVAGIKARLGLSQTKWVDEVPYVLWAHRTTPKRSTGETPFSLVYDTEAVITVVIRVPTQRILAFDTENNSSILRENLNLLEERRIMAAIRQADAKQKMAKYYNKRVRYVQFKEGDLVLRDNEASRQKKQGKLGPRWEGPYKVVKVHPNGSYTLSAPFGEEIPRTWNAMILKKFYA
ncbi:uncharacterized protein [Rutidosis leptorrhynchoides]|uniref:uncharacterized protein n=1 Tax=Rutidosis leptorrhynchoides TaxID=125765 RepID=UPI003A9A0000